ncbi:50S ribosomal protein L23 [Candidatus Parcubacteria bacterium]|nr:MAG: 50S ribosomal protein L23 [Candidatus Parcubacteria bacterium]
MGLFKKDTKEDVKEPKTQSKAKPATKKEAKKEETKKVATKDLYKDDKKVIKKGEKNSSKTKAYKVLVKPLITEKAASLSAEHKYVFAVSKKANKIEIAESVLEVYGIRPVAVNIVTVLGKKVRYGRTMGKRKDWKKAVVTLPKGKTINIYEGV